jgi:hypothetical protein
VRSYPWSQREESDMEGYANRLAHLVEELQRLDLRIRVQVQQVRRNVPGTTHEFKGFYIAEEEINAIMAADKPWETRSKSVPPDLIPLLEGRPGLKERIAARKAASQSAGNELRQHFTGSYQCL